jgi:hypothetical protein
MEKNNMDTLSCVVGHWRAEARIQQVETGKLLAMICVSDATDGATENSRHTAVFDHHEGNDTRVETEAVVQRILHDRYGV